MERLTVAASIYDWSRTAASNATADSGINWQEGQLPGTVNDSARQMMARMAEWLADQGALTASGTNTIAVTARAGFSTYATGRVLAFKAANSITGAATLNVNTVGAKAIKKIVRSGESDVTTGDIIANGIYVVRYDEAANAAAGAWVLINPSVPVIGTDVQAYDADLAAIAALTSAANKVPYATGSGAWALADFTSAGRALLDDADANAQLTTLGGTSVGTGVFKAVDAAAARTAIGAVIGTDVQAYSANLDEYAAVNPTTAGLALLDDANADAQLTTLGGTSVGTAVFTAANAAAARTAIGAVIGTDVQAYSANLAGFADIDPDNVLRVDVEQSFDDEQKERARGNLGLAGAIPLSDYAASRAEWTSIRSGATAVDTVWAAAEAAARAAGRALYLPAGTYVTSDGGILTNDGVLVFGDGPELTTVQKVGTGPLFRTAGTSPTISGGLLDANATAGAMSVTLQTGAAASFAVDDLVIILDETSVNSISGARKQAEFVRIQAIDGDEVTFWSPVTYTYTTASLARLVKPTFKQNVGYRDLTILMDEDITIGASTDPGDGHPAILVKWGLRSVVQNVRFRNLVHPAVALFGCVDAVAETLTFEIGGSTTSGSSDPASTEGKGGWSYGVVEQGLNAGLRMADCLGRNIRHVYTTTTAKTAEWGGSSSYGEPYGSLISDCVGIECKNATFDTHEAGRGIRFAECVSLAGHFVGFQIRSRETVVSNCAAVDHVGAAVWIRGGTASATQGDYCIVNGFQAIRTNLGTSFDSTDWTEYGALLDEGSFTVIDGLHVAETGGGAIYTGRNGIGGGGVYRRISAVNACAAAPTNKSLVYIHDLVSGRKLSIYDVQSAGAGVTDIVTIASNDGTIVVSDVYGADNTGSALVVSGSATVVRRGISLQGTAESDASAINVSLAVRRSASVTGQNMTLQPDSIANRFYSDSLPSSARRLDIIIRTDASDTAVSGGALGYRLYIGGVLKHEFTASGMGFNAATPVGKQTLSAALATDGSATNANIATAINAIRTALINYGLCQ